MASSIPTPILPSIEDTPTAPVMPPKRKSLKLDTDEIASRLRDWYDQDIRDRLDWSNRRLQRYAKYRGWLEAKDAPWPDASNAYIPLMMTDSQQMQDTLHNGVLSQRPVMTPQAYNPADRQKCEEIANLLDYQFFVEQPGEEKLSTLIESFVNDGTMYSLQAWIKDEQESERVETFAPLDPAIPVDFQLRVHLEQIFSDHRGVAIVQAGKNQFAWKITWLDENQQPQQARADFYTADDGRLLCIIKEKKTLFEGPCVIPKLEEDIVYPARSANLQPPSPSNPGGAHHVFIVDYPHKDELKRLIDSGYYDLVSSEELTRLEEEARQRRSGPTNAYDPEQHKIQRDTMAGELFGNSDVSGQIYTRLMCFARWDLDGDGFEENVVFWYLYEHRVLLRAKLMQEMFPSDDNQRPLVSEQFIPVPGEVRGIGLLELLEHLQDMMKLLVDQVIDKNTLVNTPWFTFRASAGVRPEVIRMAPGEGYPVADPSRDINFPQIPYADQTLSLNLLAIFNQWAERQAVIGELQFGRVPQGKASALRTTSGMMAVLQQGAARPERLIRRFFLGLSKIYAQMHKLNTVYLKPKKMYRILGMSTPGADPYRTLDDPSKIKGRFQFEFKANSLNTNKAVRGQILQQLGAMTFNPLTMQLGIATPENVYNWLKDIYDETGQDPNRYLNPPSPQSAMPKITAEQAMGLLMQGYIPEQLPAEGPMVHLQRLQELFGQLQREGSVDSALSVLFETYLQKVKGLALQAQLMAQQAAQFSGMLSGQGGGNQNMASPAEGLTPQPTGQMIDETLPGAKGPMGQF